MSRAPKASRCLHPARKASGWAPLAEAVPWSPVPQCPAVPVSLTDTPAALPLAGTLRAGVASGGLEGEGPACAQCALRAGAALSTHLHGLSPLLQRSRQGSGDSESGGEPTFLLSSHWDGAPRPDTEQLFPGTGAVPRGGGGQPCLSVRGLLAAEEVVAHG